MTNNKQTKVQMPAAKSVPDRSALEGARRATGDALGSAAQAAPAGGDVYSSSSLSTSRRQREAADLAALAPQKRAPKVDAGRADALHIAQLTRDNDRLRSQLDKAHPEIEVQKRSWCAAGPARTRPQARELLMAGVHELTPALGRGAACRSLGLWEGAPERQAAMQHRKAFEGPVRPRTARPRPPLALDTQERQVLLETLHSERFVDTAPAAVHATLLDEGSYLGSVRTMYRLLAADGGSRDRRDQLVHPSYAKPELLATGPNQVWSWDITKLKGPAKWTCFHLYVILEHLQPLRDGVVARTARAPSWPSSRSQTPWRAMACCLAR